MSLVILSGPSGVGKDTVLEAWIARNPKVERVVACTTRKPRHGEVDGVDYRFVDRAEFDRLAASGAFLEHKEVFGNGYATPLDSMQRLLDQGKIAVLKIDVQGAETAMALRPDAVAIFLLPPSIEELDRRIRARASDHPNEIERRLAEAHAEIAASAKYHHRIVNADLGETVDQLEQIVR